MSDPKRKKRSPTKGELATWKVQEELGQSGHAIASQAGRDGKTVRKWLQSEVYQNDVDLQDLVAHVRAKEAEDLVILGAKARQRLHELVESETKLIPLIALVDRSFQQVRLLQGKSTQNVSLIAQYYAKVSMSKPRNIELVQSNVENLLGRMTSADPEETALTEG